MAHQLLNTLFCLLILGISAHQYQTLSRRASVAATHKTHRSWFGGTKTATAHDDYEGF